MTKSLLQAMKNIIKSMNQNAEKCLCPMKFCTNQYNIDQMGICL